MIKNSGSEWLINDFSGLGDQGGNNKQGDLVLRIFRLNLADEFHTILTVSNRHLQPWVLYAQAFKLFYHFILFGGG